MGFCLALHSLNLWLPKPEHALAEYCAKPGKPGLYPTNTSTFTQLCFTHPSDALNLHLTPIKCPGLRSARENYRGTEVSRDSI